MKRHNIWVSSWELLHQNLVRTVRERVAGLLVEREQRPHLPTAQALVVVAAQVLRQAEHYFKPSSVERFDEAASNLRQTLEAVLKEERGKIFGITKAQRDAGPQQGAA